MATQGRRRALGQHFLRDTSIAGMIAETALEKAALHQCSALLEVGPGRGAITHPILEKLPHYSDIRKFLLVERDEKIATFWKIQSLSTPLMSVETADFLDLTPEQWLCGSPLAVVSNLPYSAGTAILDRLARQGDSIPVMVLMFQAEVAIRLRAGPSSQGRGSLSVWLQNRWDVEKLMGVPPRAFSPPPDVNSEVVVLTRRKEPRIQISSDPKSEAHWESFLKTCFAHRRKMLRSVLPWRNALELSGVDGTKRAEALDWPEWDSLYQAVKKISLLPPT